LSVINPEVRFSLSRLSLLDSHPGNYVIWGQRYSIDNDLAKMESKKLLKVAFVVAGGVSLGSFSAGAVVEVVHTLLCSSY